MAEVMSVSEAARVLGVSAQTVRSWADHGKLPAMRTSVGQRIFKRAVIARARRAIVAARRAADALG
jgi:excisionase family DNA binding protein